MSLITIIIIAIGLSVDSFAVSVANGLSIRGLTVKKTLLISFSLAFFQALMPLLGWYAGVGVESYVKDYDHWFAFVLLALLGGKMIYDAVGAKEECKTFDLKASVLLGQSLATSIDAFAVGISFALLKLSISTPVIIIGVVTFFASIIGLRIGKYLGDKSGRMIEIFGGFVLFFIGLKILLEHTVFM